MCWNIGIHLICLDIHLVGDINNYLSNPFKSQSHTNSNQSWDVTKSYATDMPASLGSLRVACHWGTATQLRSKHNISPKWFNSVAKRGCLIETHVNLWTKTPWINWDVARKKCPPIDCNALSTTSFSKGPSWQRNCLKCQRVFEVKSNNKLSARIIKCTSTNT